MEIGKITEQYQRWCKNVALDKDLVQELRGMAHTPAQIEDAFYCDLGFNAGGLRGVVGVGTNRTNIYTVAKASREIADYTKKNFAPMKRRIAISYNSHIKPDIFSEKAAEVLSVNGIYVSIYNELISTPYLSYVVRRLGCTAEVMVTASHNPSKYNGYKVYGVDGCQITTKAAKDIFAEIQKLDIFNDVKVIDSNRGMNIGLISWIDEKVYIDFIETVKRQSILFGDKMDKSVSVVYSPLDGTGLKPILHILKKDGCSNIYIVGGQEQPDGHSPTCPYPNPEMREAVSLGMGCASRCGARLLLVTDPDCDYVGVVIKDTDDEVILLSGNETGILLLDFICSQHSKHHAIPNNPVMVKTVVTIDMAERIAKKYGIKTINVLTSFKFIGERIRKLENRGKKSSSIFGFGESYGCLSGEYVRDKDAVGGASLICRMFVYYRSQGISLLDRLSAIYSGYGYCLNTLHSYESEGSIRFERMRSIMAGFHSGITHIRFSKVEEECDYLEGPDDLPTSNVLKFLLDGGCSVIIRPSGTEPKLEVYISVNTDSRAEAMGMEAEISKTVCRYIGDDGKQIVSAVQERKAEIHLNVLKEKRKKYSDLYQIIIKHSRAWTVRELIFFLISFITVVVYVCNLLSKKRIMLSRAAAGPLLSLSLGVVFGSTVFTWIPGERQHKLELFWSWKRILNGGGGLLKENLLSCILLIPAGMLLPIMLNHNVRWWKVLLTGIATSAMIETCRLVSCRGLFEWGDMIRNGVGCMIGCVIMEIWGFSVLPGTRTAQSSEGYPEHQD